MKVKTTVKETVAVETAKLCKPDKPCRPICSTR